MARSKPILNKIDIPIEKETKVITFGDDNNGCRSGYKLDFASPRTRKAAKEIGVIFEDCLLKYHFICL